MVLQRIVQLPQPQRFNQSVPALVVLSASLFLILEGNNLAAIVPAPVSSVQFSSPGTQLLARESRVRRVQFAPGRNSMKIDDTAIGATRNIYVISGKQGQLMTINLISDNENIVFDVLAPATKTGRRRPLQEEGVSWVGTLPQSGDYQIVVGSLRGNAAYTLQLSLR